MATSLLTFAGVFALSAAIPGSDTLLLVSRVLVGGPAAAIPLAAGILLAKLLLLTLAFVGITALLTAFASAVVVLKLAGAAYLVYLGGMRWRNARRATPPDATQPAHRRRARGVATGLAFGLANTQAILFYAALMPQVLGVHGSSAAEYAGLCLTLSAVFAVVAGAYIGLASRFRERLAARGGASAGVDRVAGALLATTGVVIAVR